jgi:hypothetical protein
MLTVHLVDGYRRHTGRRAFLQAFVIGVSSVVVALPWLWFNVSRFGHIVPVSGRAESHGFVVGANLLPALAAMVEDMLLLVRIPQRLEVSAGVQLFCGGILALVIGACVLWRRWLAANLSAGIGILTCFVVMLFLYYSLCFKAPHFLGRYFFPVVMLSSTVVAAILVSLVGQVRDTRTSIAAALAVVSAGVMCAALDVRTYLKGCEHLHFQVVDWVAANVPEDAWVGAIQTGTLGYYHERTINLDGKVDPNALAAQQKDRLSEYVLERNVEYIVDWAGIAMWASLPKYGAYFELIVDDRESNLAVLRRRTGVPRQYEGIHQ